jgi:predicted metal-dependent peptidase
MRVVTPMQKARAALVLRDPFLASLALRLNLIESDKIPTAATNGVDLLYNPKYIESIAQKYGEANLQEYCKGLWFHEVFHNAMGHQVRKGDREHRMWNLAADFAIDHIGVDGGYKIPDALLRDDFKGLDAETIYSKLQQDQQEDKCPGCGKPKKGTGEPGEQECQCPGSGEGDGIPQGAGEVLPFPGEGGGEGKEASSGDMEQQAQEWKVALVQAAQTAKVQGKLSAHFQGIIGELTTPKVPWREALARWLTEVSRNDYTWSQPNRRHMVRGIYLPHLESETIGLVGIIWDTSGSVGKKEATMIASETQGVLSEYQSVEIILLHVDSAFQGEQLITADDVPLDLTPLGGGGTNFRPGFKRIEDEDHPVVGVIYMTDGYCSDYPDEEPDYPVIWCLTEKCDSFQPPWGEIIHIDY